MQINEGKRYKSEKEYGRQGVEVAKTESQAQDGVSCGLDRGGYAELRGQIG